MNLYRPDTDYSRLRECMPPRDITEALAERMIKTEIDCPYFKTLWRVFTRLKHEQQVRVMQILERDAAAVRTIREGRF